MKILFIGNSYSDDTSDLLYRVAKSQLKEKIKIGNMFIGGCTLYMHLENALNDAHNYDYRTNYANGWHTKPGTSLKEAILDEDWDYISIQQGSGDRISSTGSYESFDKFDLLIDYVRSLNSDATLLFNMTWSDDPHSSRTEFEKYDRNEEKMYLSIIDTTKRAVCTNGRIEKISPTGTAIENARFNFGGTITRDGFHLSYDRGRYIAALTFFGACIGFTDLSGIYVPNDMEKDVAAVCLKCALDAIEKPFEPTRQ